MVNQVTRKPGYHWYPGSQRCNPDHGKQSHMAHKLQCEQFMRLKAKNAQYVSSPSDKTVLQNLLVNISMESLEALRHEECLKIALALFQVILLETSKRPIFSSSCSTSSSRSSSSRNFKNSSF